MSIYLFCPSYNLEKIKQILFLISPVEEYYVSYTFPY